jgi:hypothetical protein
VHGEGCREVLDAQGAIFERGKHVELHPGHHGKRGVDGSAKPLNRVWSEWWAGHEKPPSLAVVLLLILGLTKHRTTAYQASLPY